MGKKENEVMFARTTKNKGWLKEDVPGTPLIGTLNAKKSVFYLIKPKNVKGLMEWE